ncbi:MAG: response regulator [Candidatus Rokuibacteriota bacterium]
MRVLVVDDTESVRFLLVRWLGALGHEAVVAGSGAEALAQLDASSFDAVLTDVTMPDTSGWDVLAAARAHRRDLPVVLMTGWDDGAAGRGGLVPDGVLEKPFTIDRVREVLAGFDHPD